MPTGQRLVSGTTLAGLSLAVVSAWLAAALSRPLPAMINQALVLGLVAVVAVKLSSAMKRLVDGTAYELEPSQGRWLLALVALGFVTAFVGVEHEIGGRYFGDEGTFLANAQRMNEGRILRPWFIYPHLLYTLDAIALWAASLFPGITEGVARRLWGVRGELEVAALVTRWVTACFVAATPPVVFQMARRVAGVPSGLVAGTIAALSTLWLSVGHQSISDVPAAFFATLCLAACAELVVHPPDGDPRSRHRVWLVAGVAAGLAAGSKYPAGLVAVAIAAVWIRQGFLTKRLSWDLAKAGGASILAFLAATPSLVVYHRQLFTADGPGLLFGARLYAEAGWAGVIRGSNLRYYGDLLGGSFSWLLLVVGAFGLLLLAATTRRRLLWLAPFPLAYLGLILVMRIAVPRNLMPVLPFVAVLLGCGLVAIAQRLSGAFGERRLLVCHLLVALTLAPLAYSATAHLARFARPTTRDQAAVWMETHLPKGTLIVKEHYTPVVRYPLFSRQPRFVVKLWPDEIRQPQHDFVLVASEAYDRYLNPRNLHQEEFVHFAQRYRELFAELPLIRQFEPGRWRAGPTIKLFSVDPEPLTYSTEVKLQSSDARVADDAMRHDDGSIEWLHPEGWVVFKAHLAAGPYRVEWIGEQIPKNARLTVSTRLGESIAEVDLVDGVAPLLLLPRDEKVFATLEAPLRSTIQELHFGPPPSDETSAP